MSPSVYIQHAPARILAAVQRKVCIGEVGTAWRPALDQVWDFLRQHPGLRSDGHNVFLYHHPAKRESPMDVDFGVEVTRQFEPAGEVRPIETPSGNVATALHIGPYEKLRATHDAIHAWAAANERVFAGMSWEIYGDWAEDTAKLETQVEYLLMEKRQT